MKMVVMPSRTQLVATAVAALACATLTGCGDPGGTASGDGASIKVVTSFYPLQFVTQKIGGDRVGVSSLTAPGVEPHDLELTPKQVRALSDATLVVYSKGLQPAVDEAVEQNAKDGSIDVNDAAKLEDTGAGHEHEQGGAEHEGELDPHFWLDPVKLAAVADAVAGRLAEKDPEGADGYRQRAAALDQELTTLDGEFKAGLKTCALHTFVTSHDAFGYLAKRYGLEMVGIAGLSPDAEPSPARIKEIQDVVRKEKVTTIFYEELVSPKVAESIAGDLKLKTAVLSPVEGLADDSSKDDYLSLMRANLTELRKANSCT